LEDNLIHSSIFSLKKFTDYGTLLLRRSSGYLSAGLKYSFVGMVIFDGKSIDFIIYFKINDGSKIL